MFVHISYTWPYCLVHVYMCMAADPKNTSVMQVVVDLPITSFTASMLNNLTVAIQLELERSQLDDVQVNVTDLYQLGPE